MLPDAACRRKLRQRLLTWYEAYARQLPWRRSGDPYAIWLSEIMLQQTQVETVKPYFERFMKALPTIEALARAGTHEVLRLWEGLGYYRRAKQLHQAAEIIVAEHGGRFPRDPQIVRRLPGIGRYTAGAILSIAFDAREPILEANTLRLLSRLLAYAGDPRCGEGQRLLWAMAEILLPRRNVGRFNQALMELGSEVCTARVPRCTVCPLAVLCRANQQGRQQQNPAAEDATVAGVGPRGGSSDLAWRPRLALAWPEGRRWAGLWDFPRFPIESEQPAAIGRELVENVRALTGVTVAPGRHITTFTHGVTRFRITLECYQAEYGRTRQENGRPPWKLAGCDRPS